MGNASLDQPNLPEKVVSPPAILMTTWECLSWIAFGEIRPRSDPKDFLERWGDHFVTPLLRALDARAAPEPFCPVEPMILDGEHWDGMSYVGKAVSPGGPGLLRRLQAAARKREGRFVSYGDMAAMLRAELANDARQKELIQDSSRRLLEALRASKLTAWAKRDLRRGESNPAAQYEAVPVSIFIDPLVAMTEWGTIAADPSHPIAMSKYRGPTFRCTRFYTKEVTALWPATAAGIPEHPTLAVELTILRHPPGPSPIKRAAIKSRMMSDYVGRFNELAAEKHVTLASRYKVSRDTAERARREVFEELRQNSGRTPINDK